MLLLKITLTPLFIAAATAVQRRWGSAVGGLLVGLPLTAGPVALFLALEQGDSFAAAAASGAILGLIPLSGFCVAYGWMARRGSVATATAASVFAYLLLVPVAMYLRGSLFLMFSLTVGMMAFALIAAWKPGTRAQAPCHSRFQVVWRIAAATTMVLVLTSTAEALGPHLSGILSPFPIFAGVIAVFTHRSLGGAAAAQFLRGVISGTFAYAVFFLVLSASLEPHGVAISFLIACVAAISFQTPILCSELNALLPAQPREASP